MTASLWIQGEHFTQAIKKRRTTFRSSMVSIFFGAGRYVKPIYSIYLTHMFQAFLNPVAQPWAVFVVGNLGHV